MDFLTFIPTVPRPPRRLSISRRLFWTAVVATIYILMTITPLYGIPHTQAAQGNPQLQQLLSIIFGTASGTLAHLGIGPIVIAGILMEVFAFSGVLNLDLNKREDRLKFTLMLKWAALGIAALEATAYVLGGQFGTVTPLGGVLIVLQLLLATVIILLLDDLMSKGWGIGSAISLIIFLGVSRQIFLSLFSWDTVQDSNGNTQVFGLLPALGVALYDLFTSGNANTLLGLVNRPLTVNTYLPDFVGLVATILLGYIILYLEMMKVNIPVASAQYRGIKFTIPLRFVYVSVLPIIFTTYSLLLVGQLLQPFAANNPALITVLNVIFLPHRYFDPLLIILNFALYVALAIAFAWIWVQLAGLSAEDQARQFTQSQLHVPGFRQSERVLAKILERPINALTIISGFIAGTFASLGNVLGVWGGGVGLILLVEIALQYYALVMREQLLEMYPGLKEVLSR
ncbi:preprotein translocase subunit SecY [Pyrobaculum calidifontis]|uniref:Protein translocase subunit secY/sec61 alpha n=1 Tax=Pyrobaculum calidifontis (strain DSM 21063 / JCM 11548 / VA1) TaxID=410359 RepID=A3MUZ2_PYRCJ|nr:preprotein translocase subunit SecY [Pyrobaculum calidifontis]ABO08459.1 protein translocase subunit secY/sec61 alpha [Pyrobaculum calidifontis JCM 11548]